MHIKIVNNLVVYSPNFSMSNINSKIYESSSFGSLDNIFPRYSMMNGSLTILLLAKTPFPNHKNKFEYFQKLTETVHNSILREE